MCYLRLHYTTVSAADFEENMACVNLPVDRSSRKDCVIIHTREEFTDCGRIADLIETTRGRDNLVLIICGDGIPWELLGETSV